MNQVAILYLKFFTPFVLFFGACIGSFLSVCIYRIPRNESIVFPRSHCPRCGKLIHWYMNIPIFSYLFLGGKCHNCKGKISPKYILLEIVTALLFTLIWFQVVEGMLPSLGTPIFGLTPIEDIRLLPVFWLIIFGLILGSGIDLEHYILPDRVTIGGMVVGIMMSAIFPCVHNETQILPSLLQSLMGLAIGFGGLWLIAFFGELAFKKEAMGFGDVKLMGAVGACFGWKAVLFVLFASAFVGAIVGIFLMLIKKKNAQAKIPFGPFISLAVLIWIYWGPAIVSWYIKMAIPSVR